MKKFILNADDLGLGTAVNRAVSEAYHYGILKSASLVANGDTFDDAVNKVIPECEGIGIGVHLNLTEGKALSRDIDKLTDHTGILNNSYIMLLLKSYLPGKDIFLNQVEKEFRAQIEKVINSGIECTHIDSHAHIHSIPAIFEIVCRLAKEYKISQIRTQLEKPYFIPDLVFYFNKITLINIINFICLSIFSLINKRIIKKYELTTNDFILGVGYRLMMSAITVSYGVQKFAKTKDVTLEVIIHPKRYEEGTIDNFFEEYKYAKNDKLKQKIEELGFEITNYAKNNRL